jgi:broad specificity phosphatase PhoE
MTLSRCRLHLIRHGETEWNRDGRIQGHSDPPLSAAGREQARALAERLAAEPIGELWSSDLRRALETAEPLAAQLGLDIHVSPALRERSFGVNEGRIDAEVEAELGRAITAWLGPDERHPEGESLRELYERVAAFLDALVGASPAEEIALVTSGGPIRMASAYLAREPVEAVVWTAVENCSVTTVEV